MTYVNIYLENLSIPEQRTTPLVARPSSRDRVTSAAAGIGRSLGPVWGPVVP